MLIDALELTQRPEIFTRHRTVRRAPRARLVRRRALVAALEDRFDITIDDDEFGAELFETVGTLADFVDAKLASV